MSKNAGYLVETKTGLKGKVFHKEEQINKKIVVHLIDENNNIIVDGNGKETKMLCDPKTIKTIGFVD